MEIIATIPGPQDNVLTGSSETDRETLDWMKREINSIQMMYAFLDRSLNDVNPRIGRDCKDATWLSPSMSAVVYPLIEAEIIKAITERTKGIIKRCGGQVSDGNSQAAPSEDR